MEKVRLEDVCDKASSNIAQKDLEKNEGKFPIYGASGFIKNVDFYKQEKEYIAVVKDGAGVGRIIKCPAKSSVIGTMQYILPKENVDIEFLAFSMENMNLAKYYSGATIPHIYFKDYCKEEFLLPTILEQKAIANVLNKITGLINKRKEQLSKLNELVKARFVELFGDVKTNKFGWEKCHFGDVATKITDGEHGTVPRVEKGKGYLYFMARNITKDGNIDLTETSYVPEEVHRKIYKRCNPETGDILLVCVGATIGKCTIVPKDFEEFTMARSVALIKPDRQKVNSTFLIFLLKSDAIQNDISNCAHAAAQAGLYTNMIINLDAFLPPIELQNQFAAFVEQTDKSKLEIQKSLEKIELLKKTLMQKYFG